MPAPSKDKGAELHIPASEILYYEVATRPVDLAVEPAQIPSPQASDSSQQTPDSDQEKSQSLSPVHETLLLLPNLQSSLLAMLDDPTPAKSQIPAITTSQFTKHVAELHKLKAKIRTLNIENTELKRRLADEHPSNNKGKIAPVGDSVASGVGEGNDNSNQRQGKEGSAMIKGKGKAKAEMMSKPGESMLNQMGTLFDDTAPLPPKPNGIDPARITDCAYRLTEGADARAIAGELLDEVERAHSGENDDVAVAVVLKQTAGNRGDAEARLHDIEGILDIMLTRIGDLEDGFADKGKKGAKAEEWDSWEGCSYHV